MMFDAYQLRVMWFVGGNSARYRVSRRPLAEVRGAAAVVLRHLRSQRNGPLLVFDGLLSGRTNMTKGHFPITSFSDAAFQNGACSSCNSLPRTPNEEKMNIRTFAAFVIAATTATSALADADHRYPQNFASNGWLSSSTAAAKPNPSASVIQPAKWRGQVQQESAQARQDGPLPLSKLDRTPSAEMTGSSKE